MSDLPQKPRDRQRPFLKLEPRPAPGPIDGDGAARGCFTPQAFGDLDQGAIDVLTQNVEALGLLHDAIKAARDAVAIARPIIQAAMMLAAAGLLGATGPAAILAIVPVMALITTIIETTADVLDVIERKIIGRFAKRLLPRACRVMPHWVPVTPGASSVRVDDGQIVEVQGIVTRSYQNPTDVPFAQWHRWFNWSIHLQPDAAFADALSPAGHPPTDAPREPQLVPIQDAGTIECHWDIGALVPAAVDDASSTSSKAAHSGPMTRADWAWPMPGQFVWAAGRWVYDCSRSTAAGPSGRMATILNPLKAIATARLEGFKFPENERPVPATQFMFFTCRRGGYIDHDAINDRDYEFIVDLPEIEDRDPVPFPIGRTIKDGVDFAHNTIVIRPRLLIHVNTGAFADSGAVGIDPIIEPLPPETGRVPIQVRVKVPTTSLPGSAQACGFVLSLGWFDPEGAQAEKIREVTVTLKRIEGTPGRAKRDTPDEITRLLREAEQEIKEDAKKKVRADLVDALGSTLGNFAAGLVDALIDVFVDQVVDRFLTAFTGAIEDLLSSAEEWLVHVGVNGRWFATEFDFSGNPRALDRTVRFFLPTTTEPIRISMSTVDFDPVGDRMLERLATHGLDLDGSVVPWPVIVEPSADPATALAIRKRLVLRYVFKLLATLGDDNDPIGFIDAKHFGLGDGRHDPFFQQAFFTRALDDQRTYVSDAATPRSDHSIHYSIEIKPVP